MANKEPTLEFGRSDPDHFYCSICRGTENEVVFTADGTVEALIGLFARHVSGLHQREDVNQAAARVVREATER